MSNANAGTVYRICWRRAAALPNTRHARPVPGEQLSGLERGRCRRVTGLAALRLHGKRRPLIIRRLHAACCVHFFTFAGHLFHTAVRTGTTSVGYLVEEVL